MPAADLTEGEIRVLHKKDLNGELWLVLNEDRLVGVQGLGALDRLGGLTAMMLKGLNIRRTILKGPKPSAGRDMWPLHSLEKDLIRLLNGR